VPIDGYAGQPVTALAPKLAPVVFVRPGELRAAEWREFRPRQCREAHPAARMKMGEPHLVPLSRQAVAILQEPQPLTSRGRYVFPSLLTREPASGPWRKTQSMVRCAASDIARTIRRGGFRSTASTLLNEQGFPPDVIELQLAHAERNKVRAAKRSASRSGGK